MPMFRRYHFTGSSPFGVLIGIVALFGTAGALPGSAAAGGRPLLAGVGGSALRVLLPITRSDGVRMVAATDPCTTEGAHIASGPETCAEPDPASTTCWGAVCARAPTEQVSEPDRARGVVAQPAWAW